jgi:hypothetical protein
MFIPLVSTRNIINFVNILMPTLLKNFPAKKYILLGPLQNFSKGTTMFDLFPPSSIALDLGGI